MTADPHIERAVRIAKAIREESSDPVTFPLWKPWAIDMADGIGALAARLEAAERDLADARAELAWRKGKRKCERLGGKCAPEANDRCFCQKDWAALAAAQQPPAEEENA